ncbi:MAG: CDP-alcohol phosphatidyltransferase family protein [Gammaproteobacteria bacterium]
MAHESWTHKLARVCVRPLVGTSVTPNHLTSARLVTGLAACAAWAVGERGWDIWGGWLWLLSAFLDRADGELARLQKSASPGGHLYDYYTDVIINGVVFIAIGFGQRHGDFGGWAIAAGVLAGVTVSAASVFSEMLERHLRAGQKAYEGRAGFDFDDILYVFTPLAWLGWLGPLLAGAAVGGPVFAAWTTARLLQARRQNRGA